MVFSGIWIMWIRIKPILKHRRSWRIHVVFAREKKPDSDKIFPKIGEKARQLLIFRGKQIQHKESPSAVTVLR